MQKILFLLVLILSVSCSSGEEASSSKPKQPLAPAEAAPSIDPDPAADPLPAKKAEDIKVEFSVIDALGNKVSFDSIPNRIATISPSATEILYKAGGTAIIRDRASMYPAEVNSLPSVGSSYDPSIEDLVAQNPDLVIIEALTQSRFIGQLQQLGLKVFAIKIETIDDLYNSLTNIGTILGDTGYAESVVEVIKQDLVTYGTGAEGKTALMLIGDQDQNLYAATKKSYTGLIASLAGLENAAGDAEDSGPYPGFALMSTEQILRANPDMIFTITPAPEPAPRLSQSLGFIPPFKGLKAMQTNKVIESDVVIFLNSPGPRIVDAVAFMKENF
ncbi:MAG: hypothetical protein CL714_03585 [Chloroflexi bacterium]|nr:hypothetical protein [Chloroflexota bacterium]